MIGGCDRFWTEDPLPVPDACVKPYVPPVKREAPLRPAGELTLRDFTSPAGGQNLRRKLQREGREGRR